MSKPVRASVPVLVTGASSGLGTEFARSFAERGHDVTLVARRTDRLEAVAAEIRSAHGVAAHVVTADLETDAGRRSVVALLRRGPWILVNNAGYGSRGTFGADLDPDREVAMVELNVRALVELTGAVLPGCLGARTGGIINLASTAAFQPVPHMATYAATKAFVLHFTEAVATEHRGSGVRITAVCPGPTRTEFGDVAGNMAELESLRPMAADRCVEIALRAFDRGHTMVVTGWMNTAGSLAPRLAPRAVVRRVLAPLFAPRKDSVSSASSPPTRRRAAPRSRAGGASARPRRRSP